MLLRRSERGVSSERDIWSVRCLYSQSSMKFSAFEVIELNKLCKQGLE